ncbi:MAG: geranylgeranyl reductase family protein [Candidatus Thorarchaeota archaeon]
MMQEYDVVVIGGGPAGCSAAINCASLGLDVLLVEKARKGTRKPCGGVLPWITSEIIEDMLNVSMPSYVFNNPKTLGLYYVPPSGKENGGPVPNYKIHNIRRERFDEWLMDVAKDCGVDVLDETQLIELSDAISPRLKLKQKDDDLYIKASYVVGADGVRSLTRKLLSLDDSTDFLIVGQQLWSDRKNTDLDEYFYGFFRRDISISYSYAIPKGDDILIGTGVQRRSVPHVYSALDQFKKWLQDDFNLIDSEYIGKETWAIPFGFFTPGRGNVLLAGDAAGLCNPLSGEGIRYGIESGEAVSSAIMRSTQGAILVDSYRQELGSIVKMFRDIHNFVVSANDEEREHFVAEEIKRGIV